MLKLFSIIVILSLNLKNIKNSLDCNLVNDLSDSDLSGNRFSFKNQSPSESKAPLTYWEINPLFSKCGIIPAELTNNAKSHSKFFIHWLFNSHSSFRLSFRLEYAENYTFLNYYYSVRRYTSDEVYTRRHKFHEANETENSTTEASLEESLELKDELKKVSLFSKQEIKTAMNEPDNHLIVKFKPAPLIYDDKFDMLKNMFIVCVVIINLNTGITFTLPFMCVDIFIDKRYYKHLKLDKDDHTRSFYRQHSLGIMVTLGPLSLILFLTLVYLFYRKNKNSVLKQEMILLENKIRNMSDLRIREVKEVKKETLREESMFELDPNIIFVRKRNRHTEYSNMVRYSRYDLINDSEQMLSQEEIFINELKSIIEGDKCSESSSEYNRNYGSKINKDDEFFYLNQDYLNQQEEFLEFCV